MEKQLTVDEFISILKTAKDTDIAPIEFWVGNTEYDLKTVGQFGIAANVTVRFVKAKQKEVVPFVPQRSSIKEVKKVLNSIKKKENKK